MLASGPAIASSGLTQRDSKGVPQFAPNFTVYVLPPDVVCLYSEDRKFFLHGALYCALAAAIGAGKSCRQLVRELEQDFPSDKIHEALKRLLDRRYRRSGIALVRMAPRPPIGRASGCRRRPRREISRNVVCAFNRSTCRVQRNSAPP